MADVLGHPSEMISNSTSKIWPLEGRKIDTFRHKSTNRDNVIMWQGGTFYLLGSTSYALTWQDELSNLLVKLILPNSQQNEIWISIYVRKHFLESFNRVQCPTSFEIKGQIYKEVNEPIDKSNYFHHILMQFINISDPFM